jgi:hypothetical protein
MNVEQIKSSLSKIQPVNGYLFPTELVEQNAGEDGNPRSRSIWIVDDGQSYRVEYFALDWVGSALRDYIVDQLTQDGIEIDPQTLTINREEQDNGSATTEENLNDCCSNRIDCGNGGDAECR